jgi:hypothetical protein
MTNGNRRRPIALGLRTWGGLRGQLSITPSIYSAQGELADLTIFRWHDAAGDHAVGVNVWEPFRQSVQTLHAIVSSLTRPSPPSIPRAVAAVDGVPMTTTPGWIHGVCEAFVLTRLVCPSRLPKADVRAADVSVTPSPPSGGTPAAMQISIEWYGHPPSSRNIHPPGFGHVEISVGRIVAAKHDAKPMPIDKIQIPTGYVPTRPIPIGHPRWTPSRGLLIFGDCFGNHLCYRWHQAGQHYQIDLHAWYPLRHTVDILRAIVRATPAAHLGRG